MSATGTEDVHVARDTSSAELKPADANRGHGYTVTSALDAIGFGLYQVSQVQS